MKELILGGARSGKSALAERLAESSGLDVVYVATATAGDAEMAGRIAHHQKRRPAKWGVVEEPRQLAAALQVAADPGRCLLVDCLTLWLNNVIADDALFQRERAALLETLPGLPGRIILVSNEVGMGIVPLGELSRRFCDEAGRLHQDLAQLCERVTLVVAGLPLILKEHKQ
ncbi:MAG: bifunctional adenosylcobinamide kinase/adenosylcobinamide-phosphate guanylyltransferase [Betaproteobacteria bacterium]|nr:bifunctional adenosylcobinamide kinase/adenosylcobinamide-phosphate guanylyltransferase [Betaproteobacteria bacterium]